MQNDASDGLVDDLDLLHLPSIQQLVAELDEVDLLPVLGEFSAFGFRHELTRGDDQEQQREHGRNGLRIIAVRWLVAVVVVLVVVVIIVVVATATSILVVFGPEGALFQVNLWLVGVGGGGRGGFGVASLLAFALLALWEEVFKALGYLGLHGQPQRLHELFELVLVAVAVAVGAIEKGREWRGHEASVVVSAVAAVAVPRLPEPLVVLWVIYGKVPPGCGREGRIVLGGCQHPKTREGGVLAAAGNGRELAVSKLLLLTPRERLRQPPAGTDTGTSTGTGARAMMPMAMSMSMNMTADVLVLPDAPRSPKKSSAC
mmetsp:Transcript_5108/g.14941  ORF Transcript_5108/g.14941 Transcript_5108/m.14941 type:complete len:316 (-) Transcript_5108:163-1110(-)